VKRVVLILAALALVACVGGAQEILYRDEATLQWDAVTTDLNGDPLLATDLVQYDVYLDDGSAVDPQDTAQLTWVARTSATELVITFPARVTWYAGVRSSVTPDGGVEVLSDITWSTEPIPATAVGPFVYVPVLDGPSAPAGLRDSLQ